MVQTGTENLYRKPMHRFNFVLIRPDPMVLVFLSGNRLLVLVHFRLLDYGHGLEVFLICIMIQRGVDFAPEFSL